MQPAFCKTRIPAVAGVGRPYRLYPKASVHFRSWKETDFPKWLQSHTRNGDVAISNVQSTPGYNTVIRRTWVMAAGRNIAFKIAAKPLHGYFCQAIVNCRGTISRYHSWPTNTCFIDRQSTYSTQGSAKNRSNKIVQIFRKVGKYLIMLYFNANLCLVFTFIFSFSQFQKENACTLFWGKMTFLLCCILWKFVAYMYARYGYIHGYPRKICGYGYGYGWEISYPRQAWSLTDQ